MSRLMADENSFALFYESGTYGTPSGTGHWLGLVTNSTVNDEENVQRLRYSNASGKNVDKFQRLTEDHGGAVTFHPQDFRWLSFALGSVADSGAGPYTHNVKELSNKQQNQFTSGTLLPFISFGVEDAQYGAANGQHVVKKPVGCMVESLSYSVAEGGMAEVNLNYIAQDTTFSSGTPTTVTELALRPLLWEDHKMKLNGSIFTGLKSLGMNITLNPSRANYLNGSRVTDVPKMGNRDYDFPLTLDATSAWAKDLYEKYWQGGSEFNAQIEVNCLDAGAGSRVGSIVLSGCKITSWDAPSPIEGANENSFTISPKSVNCIFVDNIPKYAAW